ncbi:MAG TPA: segregation/condensation protein A [Solirubrobacteraceae bacterium]|nr:segregation/condensation protein A [Solirubrobacteraceae bacterium]
MHVAELEFDLDVFSGPFDLLLTLILREEVDLRELSLAEVVVGYIDHLEARGELDLEATTEFIVLIAALLELKSRLLLPGEEIDELELEPDEAAEELLQRMLEARRYRVAATHLGELVAAAPAVRYREAPLPPELRRADLDDAPPGVWDPASLGKAIAGLLVLPPRLDLSHVLVARVSVTDRISHLRQLLRQAAELRFDDAVSGADRMTVAVTVFALLELYKRGELSWDQAEPFGEITVRALSRPAARARA